MKTRLLWLLSLWIGLHAHAQNTNARSETQAPAGAEFRVSTRPNVVLILADDMGYSDIGCFGGEIETPNLDALAAGGLRYTDFHNAARCCPTRASLLTGLYPHEAGVGDMVYRDLGPGYIGRLNDRCSTLAEVLGKAGYRTLMSGKWHVGHQDKSVLPEQRGFDRFYGTYLHVDSYFKVLPESDVWLDGKLQIEGDSKTLPKNPDGSEREFYTTDVYTDFALQFLEEADGDESPFFLNLAYNAPHCPLEAPDAIVKKYEDRYNAGWDVLREKKFATMREMGIVPKDAQLPPSGNTPWEKVSAEDRKELAFRRAIYAAQVDSLDQNIGRVVRSLQKNGHLENTLILFLSDNGCSAEEGMFGYQFEKNRIANFQEWRTASKRSSSQGKAWANASNAPFREYKKDVHEGGSRTPLIAHWPARIKDAGGLRHDAGHIIDIMATACEIGRADMPEGARGLSLSPTFDGHPLEGREALYWEHEGNRAIRIGDWKLVSSYAGGKRGDWELYDLSSDPTETKDLAAGHQEKVAELQAQWMRWATGANVIPDIHERSRSSKGASKPTVKNDPDNLATAAKASFSTPRFGRDRDESVQDSVVPKTSADGKTAHRTWWPEKGNRQWAQYDFPSDRWIGATEVFWFHDHPRGGCQVPDRWRLSYRKGDRWIPVESDDAFGKEVGRFNRVQFEPVEARSFRLEVWLQAGASSGIHEWKLAAPEPRK